MTFFDFKNKTKLFLPAVPSKPENQPYLTRGATRRKLEKSAENREPKRTSRRLRKVPGTPPRTPKKAKPPDTPKSPNIVEAFRRLSQKSSSEKSRTCDFPDDIIYVEEVHITDEGVSDEEIARKMNYNRSRGNWGGPNRGGHNRPNSNNRSKPSVFDFKVLNFGYLLNWSFMKVVASYTLLVNIDSI